MRKKLITELVVTNSFELFISFLLLISGIASLTGLTSSQSISTVLPYFVQIMWGASQATGGLLTLIGLITRSVSETKFVTSLVIERAGLALLSTAIAGYSIVIVTFAPLSRTFLAASLQLALAAACVARIWAIQLVLKKLQSYHERRDGKEDE